VYCPGGRLESFQTPLVLEVVLLTLPLDRRSETVAPLRSLPAALKTTPASVPVETVESEAAFVLSDRCRRSPWRRAS
jgi:hypothetical protein